MKFFILIGALVTSITVAAQDSVPAMVVPHAEVHLFGDRQLAITTTFSDSITGDLYAFCTPGKGNFKNSVILENHIVRWTGSQWQSIGEPFDGNVESIVMYAGQLVVTGEFTKIGDSEIENIATWNGSAWTTLGSGLVTTIKDMIVWKNELVCFGYDAEGKVFESYRYSLHSFDGNEWKSISFPEMDASGTTIFDLAVFQNQLVMSFARKYVLDVQSYDGQSWNSTGISDILSAGDFIKLEVANGRLYAGGPFSCKKRFEKGAYSMIFWDGTSWHGTNCSVSNIMDFSVIGEKIFVTTDYRPAGSESHVFELHRWDGISWTLVKIRFFFPRTSLSELLLFYPPLQVAEYKNHPIVFGCFGSINPQIRSSKNNVITGGIFFLQQL